jgi:hypothetical protein
MKIHDIFERIELGKGQFATVHKDDDDPHQYNQVIRTTTGGKDGGVRWHEAISTNPQIQNNPFIPKVYKVSKQGEQYTSEIQHLYPLDSPKIAGNQLLMQTLWNEYFNPVYSTFPRTRTPSTFAKALSREITLCYWENGYKINPDTPLGHKLRQAIEFIKLVQHGKENGMDAHEGNLMWRITGTMPQLVITDPLGT